MHYIGELTPRQLEVMQLYANGGSRRNIAKELFITEETVKSHVKEIKLRLSAPTITAAVVVALRKGLIN